MLRHNSSSSSIKAQTQQTSKASGKLGGNNMVARGILIVAVFSAVTLYVSHERAHHHAPHTGTETRGFAGGRSKDMHAMLDEIRGALEANTINQQQQQAAAEWHQQQPLQQQQGVNAEWHQLQQLQEQQDAATEWQQQQQHQHQDGAAEWNNQNDRQEEPHQQQQQQQQQAASSMASVKPKPKPAAVLTKQQPSRASVSQVAANPRPAARARPAAAKPAAAATGAAASATVNPDKMVIKTEKPFDGHFILNLKQRKIGEELKQPKHLSVQGQRNRAARGKRDAAARTMKWEHIGKVDASWRDAGLLPVSDEVRSRWLEDGMGKPKASCAVVGNGGGLLGMDAGAEIDKADIVLRFNGGPVQGFERFVGRKTTYRLTNTEHFAFSDVGDETVLQHMTNAPGIGNVTKYSKKVLKKKAQGTFGLDPKDHVTVRIVEPEFHYLVMNIFSYGAPSNGFYGVVLASELCAVVTMYGFQKVWKGTKLPYHYYNDIEPNESQFGRDNTEAVYFSKWLERMNELAAENEHLEEWRVRNNWQHPRFVFAEERHSNLPRLDINLQTVPWVKTADMKVGAGGMLGAQQQRLHRRTLAMQSQLSHD